MQGRKDRKSNEAGWVITRPRRQETDGCEAVLRGALCVVAVVVSGVCCVVVGTDLGILDWIGLSGRDRRMRV